MAGTIDMRVVTLTQDISLLFVSSTVAIERVRADAIGLGQDMDIFCKSTPLLLRQ